MQWLETGAAFPAAIRIEETLYTYMEIEFCAEAIYRINETIAENARQSGASYLNSLGPSREGEPLLWQSAEALTESQSLRLSPGSGPLCFGGGPPNASRPWPMLPADMRGAYATSDGHGTWLIIYPRQRLAYFWNS